MLIPISYRATVYWRTQPGPQCIDVVIVLLIYWFVHIRIFSYIEDRTASHRFPSVNVTQYRVWSIYLACHCRHGGHKIAKTPLNPDDQLYHTQLAHLQPTPQSPSLITLTTMVDIVLNHIYSDNMCPLAASRRNLALKTTDEGATESYHWHENRQVLMMHWQATRIWR